MRQENKKDDIQDIIIIPIWFLCGVKYSVVMADFLMPEPQQSSYSYYFHYLLF